MRKYIFYKFTEILFSITAKESIFNVIFKITEHILNTNNEITSLLKIFNYSLIFSLLYDDIKYYNILSITFVLCKYAMTVSFI